MTEEENKMLGYVASNMATKSAINFKLFLFMMRQEEFFSNAAKVVQDNHGPKGMVY